LIALLHPCLLLLLLLLLLHGWRLRGQHCRCCVGIQQLGLLLLLLLLLKGLHLLEPCRV
jgi:hypothetical protein